MRNGWVQAVGALLALYLGLPLATVSVFALMAQNEIGWPGGAQGLLESIGDGLRWYTIISAGFVAITFVGWLVLWVLVPIAIHTVTRLMHRLRIVH